MKKILKISGWIGITAVLFVLFAAAISSSSDSVLGDVIIDIAYAGENYFIDQEEVRETVLDLGYVRGETRLNEIDPGRIERILQNDAFIQDAEVYKELNGDLHVDVLARKPIARVFNNSGKSVYIDHLGKVMPLSKKYTARILVVSGHISMNLDQVVGKNVSELDLETAHPDAAILNDVYAMSKFIGQDDFWKAQFNQVYVTRDKEFELIPRVGDHQILLGDAENLDKKLTKLRLFYREGLDKTGWNEYKTLNLKYTNQVVCTKT